MVNSISDSISVVDLATGSVVRTVRTGDEPADVIFAGTPQRAFVTCSQANLLQVFDPRLDGRAAGRDRPRRRGAASSVARTEPRSREKVARVRQSLHRAGSPPAPSSSEEEVPNVVSDPLGPYGGVNPPPNAGTGLRSSAADREPPPPAVGLIVKRDAQDRWMDDNGGRLDRPGRRPNAASVDSRRRVGRPGRDGHRRPEPRRLVHRRPDEHQHGAGRAPRDRGRHRGAGPTASTRCASSRTSTASSSGSCFASRAARSPTAVREPRAPAHIEERATRIVCKAIRKLYLYAAFSPIPLTH